MEIEKMLENNRKSFRYFPLMPYPNNFIRSISGNRLVYA